MTRQCRGSGEEKLNLIGRHSQTGFNVRRSGKYLNVPTLPAKTNMKHTVARLAFVAIVAVVIGVSVALVVYFTLLAALIFLLVATVTTVAIQMNFRKRAQGSLESGKATSVRRLTRPSSTAYTSSAHDEDQR